MYELARKYGLQLPHSVVLEGLVSLCKKSKDHIWRGSQQELANYVLCGRMVAGRSLKHLEEKGIILKRAGGYMLAQNEQVNAQNEQKEERSKEEKINKKESSVSKDATELHTTFSIFFELFLPYGDYKNYRGATFAVFKKLSAAERGKAVARAAEFASSKNPLFYLQDKDYENESAPTGVDKREPENWTGRALDPNRKYAIAKYNGKFGMYTVEDIEEFRLERAPKT